MLPGVVFANKREYLQAQGVSFEEYDIETTDKGASDFAAMGAKGVPVILVGERRLSGFMRSSLQAALEGR